MSLRNTIHFRITSCGALAALCAMITACGGPDAFDPLENDLEVIREIQNGLPDEVEENLHEVEMGEHFAINRQSKEGNTYAVSFTLYGMIDASREAEFAEILPERQERVKEAIRMVVERAAVEHLESPGLISLKEQLMRAINRELHTRILQSVAFPEFSLEAV